MTTVVIVIHLMVVLAMIGLVLLQRSEGGALGIGGGQGAFMSGRGAGNVLTRSTAVLAVVFFATSLGLALIAKYQQRPADILERIPGQTAPIAAETPAPPTPSGGAPATAEELLQQLGGSSTTGGPQTPPAGDGAAAPATPAPATEAPAETPAAQDAAPPATTTPAPQTPPASGTSQ
jgi:preprotein translocase subunit SecG